MNERLKNLIELRKAALEHVDAVRGERDAVLAAGEARDDKSLTAEELAEVRAKDAAVKDALGVAEDLDAQIRDLESEIERSGALDARSKEIIKVTTSTEVREPATYEKGSGQSYFRDLAKTTVGMGDANTAERLRRHAVDVDTDKELRKIAKVGAEYRNLDRNDGSGGYAVPPLWVMQRFIELSRAGKAYANLVPTEALPSGTDSINIPKILTGTSVAPQTADNAAIDEQDLTDGSVQANVKTIAGQQGLAIQLIDQSPVNFDEMVFRDLAADYALKTDIQVISGSNANGQVKGIRNATGIITIAATDTGTEVSKGQTAWKKVGDAIQRIHTQRFAEAEVIVMHPRRWAAFSTLLDTTGRPLVVTAGPGDNQLATFAGVVSQRVVGYMHGLPVVTDPNLPTTVGAGTNEDVIHVVRASDLLLFESSIRTRALQETRATTLTVLLQVYGYLAFTAERQPKSIVEISGTALTPPTFA